MNGHPLIGLSFDNAVSRTIRGTAILLMVANHAFPGKIIGFAVPLFSFLVGYGYNFARQRDMRHSVKRVWHLLSHFWFLLFLVCIPSALISGHTDLKWQEVAFNMFGLSGKYNFFCWYIYFYLVAMAFMPALSQVIDRHGFKGFALLSALCGSGAVILWYTLGPKFSTPWAHVGEIAYRCLRYMPIVLCGYYLARTASSGVMARINLTAPAAKRRGWMALTALAILPAIYWSRGLPYAQVFDFMWAALACGCIARIFHTWKLAWIRKAIECLGIESMGIWFLHALFFTHTTRALYWPLVKWVPVGICRYLLIVALSFAFAWATSRFFAWSKGLLAKAGKRLRPRQLFRA